MQRVAPELGEPGSGVRDQAAGVLRMAQPLMRQGAVELTRRVAPFAARFIERLQPLDCLDVMARAKQGDPEWVGEQIARD
jgi:hypothetical protein